jgi:hypothetical protein
MPSYFVEIYAPGESNVADLVARARTAARGDVRYIRSVFVPEDETCFHLFKGGSADELSRAFNGARITEAVEEPQESSRGI